ncbi:hypothetical protein C8R47DRAFT_608693 [Mycena vitilis]|nr:hypothetical protein C8R47DRAFT_608693 [Mycena vitilis]
MKRRWVADISLEHITDGLTELHLLRSSHSVGDCRSKRARIGAWSTHASTEALPGDGYPAVPPEVEMEFGEDASPSGLSQETILTPASNVADCDHLMEDARLQVEDVKSEPPTEEDEIEYACQLVPVLRGFFGDWNVNQKSRLTSVYRELKRLEANAGVAEVRFISDEGWKRLDDDPRVCASKAWRNSEYSQDEDSLIRAFASSRHDWRKTHKIKWRRGEHCW